MMVGITRFKRTEKAKWEWGIATSRVDNLAGEIDTITDMKGIVVPVPIWQYQDSSHWGCFMVPRELI